MLRQTPLDFVSENHVLWAWSEMMALPVIFLSFARSDGVLDDWSIGKHLTGYSPRKVQGRQCLCGLPDFQNPSLNSRPLLQYSITPTTPGSEGRLLAPFQGAPNKATSSGRGFFIFFLTSPQRFYIGIISIL